MKIAVMGSGGVGGYFGARLAQAGEDVILIARGAHLKAMRESGLYVESTKGDFMVNPVRATDNPVEAGVVDAVLVAVKAWQVKEAAKAIRPMVGPDTIVIPLENGVEAPADLVAFLGEGSVLGGLSKIVSRQVAPGRIRHEGAEPRIEFGELDNRRTDRAEKFLNVLQHAGIASRIPHDIHVAMWEKLLFIASASGIGAVTRCPIGIIRAVPETRAMLEEAMNEVFRVARAKNIDLPEGSAQKAMGFIDALPPESTTSMQRDVAEGKPSELDQQNGAVVRFGRETGVPTPVHIFLYNCLLPLERLARGALQAPV